MSQGYSFEESQRVRRNGEHTTIKSNDTNIFFTTFRPLVMPTEEKVQFINQSIQIRTPISESFVFYYKCLKKLKSLVWRNWVSKYVDLEDREHRHKKFMWVVLEKSLHGQQVKTEIFELQLTDLTVEKLKKVTYRWIRDKYSEFERRMDIISRLKCQDSYYRKFTLSFELPG